MNMKGGSLYFILLLLGAAQALNTNTTQAQQFLEYYNDAAMERYFQSVSASWAYNTNLTEHNQKLMEAQQLIDAEFSKQAGLNASMYNWTSWESSHPDIYRQFSKLASIGIAALNDSAKIEELTSIMSNMEKIYGEGKLCRNDECLTLEPDLTRLLRSSRDYSELLWAWEGWRDVVGREVGELYPKFVELSNEAAEKNGFEDNGDYWRSWYETPTLREDVEKLWNQMKPLYQELHAFVRHNLTMLYGEDKFPGGFIPAHVLGNMWAQSWNSLYNDLRPYKDKESVDVTPNMLSQNYTAKKMFEVSDDFFASLGLDRMPNEFWNESMITKPEGREVQCHASAWDFYNQKDFRIKQCTDVTMDDLITVHHEMGHVEYFLLYKDQPVVYRGGANPGFHEAVGDVLALSVSTPAHLKEIGLLDKVDNDTESDINFLLSMALEKIAFLPFGYLMDLWRWDVFDGKTSPQNYNEDWWKLRCKYQGIYPAVERKAGDFDPGAKFHIPGNTPYIRYFVSFVIQFQFHKALCAEANQTDVPLYKCDIYRSTDAGTKLRNMLSAGSSKKWPEAMEMVTGGRTMDSGPLLEYFEPLLNWLKMKNKENGVKPGWNEDKCPELPSDKSSASLPSLRLAVAVIAFVSFLSQRL